VQSHLGLLHRCSRVEWSTDRDSEDAQPVLREVGDLPVDEDKLPATESSDLIRDGTRVRATPLSRERDYMADGSERGLASCAALPDRLLQLDLCRP
jgi:hypothetical protein